MKYCLRCGQICAEDSDVSYYDENTCETCGYKLEEDDMTPSKYNLMSEKEKDEYEQRLLKIIQTSSVFDERLYNMYSKYGTPNFYFYFRYDKFEQMTGKRAGRKLTEEEMAIKKEMQEKFGKNSPAYQKALLDQYIQAADRERKANNSNNNNNVPRCPVCQSANLSRISSLKKATKIGLFGIFGAGDIGKTWKCNNCGSRF